jgi:hypothetical protein
MLLQNAVSSQNNLAQDGPSSSSWGYVTHYSKTSAYSVGCLLFHSFCGLGDWELPSWRVLAQGFSWGTTSWWPRLLSSAGFPRPGGLTLKGASLTVGKKPVSEGSPEGSFSVLTTWQFFLQYPIPGETHIQFMVTQECKGQVPSPTLEQLWRAVPGLELPMGSAEA